MNLRENTMNKDGNRAGKKANILFKIVTVIFLIISIFDIALFIKVGMIPLKYLVPIILIIFALNILSLMFVFRRKTHRKKRAISAFINSIVICILAVITVYVLKAYDFLGEMSLGVGQKEQNYSVIVLKKSKYSKIKDLKGKVIEYFNNDMQGTEEAVEKLKEVVSVDAVGNGDLTKLANDLLEGDAEAILVEDSYKTILSEEIEDFESKTKTIYTFKVKVDVQAISKDIKVASEPFNVFVSGIDTYGEIASVSRSDVNMLITVNPKTNQILLTNIPRDYYVQLNGTKGTKDKITHAGIYGIEKSVKTVEDLLDVEINYYLKINFTSLEDVVDALGGITVYSKYEFSTYLEDYKFKEGDNKVDGKLALAFARERKSFAAGDRMRGENQQAVIQGMMNKISNPSVVAKFNKILKSMDGKFQTNMGKDKMMDLIKYQIDKMPEWKITSIGLNGVDSKQYTYSGGSQRLYVMLPSITSVNAAQALIKQVMTGEEINTKYLDEASSTSNIVKAETYTGEVDSNADDEEVKVDNSNIKNKPTNNGKDNTNNNVDIYGE